LQGPLAHKKNGPKVFERGDNLLQNCILNFTFRLSEPSGITLKS